jgi:hypothetical protein
MIKVKISKAIALEYELRETYEFIGKAGTYSLSREQANELKEDAIFQALYTDCPSGSARAYSALASNLMESLA